MKKKISVFIFIVIYIALIVKLLVFKGGRAIGSDRAINIELFYTIKNYTLALYNGNITLKNYLLNIVGNVFIFVPIGIMLPYIMIGMKKFNTFVALTIFVLGIEAYQLEKNIGVFDIDDILLNVLGIIIGIIIYSIIIRSRGFYEKNKTR